MEVSFPSGLKVDVSYKGFIINTDQPQEAGGDASAPTPFDLFLASLASCAGIYVLNFCKSRGINTKDMRIIVNPEYDPVKRLISTVNIDILLPEGFPDEYKEAVIRSAELCTVKRHLENPPKFMIQTIKKTLSQE